MLEILLSSILHLFGSQAHMGHRRTWGHIGAYTFFAQALFCDIVVLWQSWVIQPFKLFNKHFPMAPSFLWGDRMGAPAEWSWKVECDKDWKWDMGRVWQSLQTCGITSGSRDPEGFLREEAFELGFKEWVAINYMDMGWMEGGRETEWKSTIWVWEIGTIQFALSTGRCYQKSSLEKNPQDP